MPSWKGRILCVDDNDDARELVRVMLATSGYDIKCVESPFESAGSGKEGKIRSYILLR